MYLGAWERIVVAASQWNNIVKTENTQVDYPRKYYAKFRPVQKYDHYLIPCGMIILGEPSFYAVVVNGEGC